MEVYGVDTKDFKDWDFGKTDKVTNWNGRSVGLRTSEPRISCIVDYELKVGAEYSWGGSEEPKGSVSVGVGASDDKGNSASLNVEHDSHGKTTASVEVEHAPSSNSK